MKARTFVEGYQSLWALVMERSGDGEAYLEFAQGLPTEQLVGGLGTRALVKVCGNSRAEVACDLAELFTGGLCQTCKSLVGERNSVPLKVRGVPNSDGFFVARGGVILFCFSEKFVDALYNLGVTPTSFRECVTSRRKIRSFELVGTPFCRTVAVAQLGTRDRSIDSASLLSGWICSECGTRSFYYIHPDLGLREFVAEADLSRSSSAVLVVASGADMHLCFRRTAWLKLSQEKFRGLVSCPIQIVSSRDVVRMPELPQFPSS